MFGEDVTWRSTLSAVHAVPLGPFVMSTYLVPILRKVDFQFAGRGHRQSGQLKAAKIVLLKIRIIEVDRRINKNL